MTPIRLYMNLLFFVFQRKNKAKIGYKSIKQCFYRKNIQEYLQFLYLRF